MGSIDNLTDQDPAESSSSCPGLDGVTRGETCLNVTLSETAKELRAVARSDGWSLDGLLIYELTRSEGMLASDAQHSLFHPSEVELSDTIKAVTEQVTQHSPRA